jgi:Fe-S cluster biogenesis protein NfuA
MEDLRIKIEQLLESDIRAYLQADGGDIEIVSCEKSRVVLRFLGACKTCSANKSTFKVAIERLLKKNLPDLEEVVLYL